MALLDFHGTCRNIVCCSLKNTLAFGLQLMLHSCQKILCMQWSGSAYLVHALSLYVCEGVCVYYDCYAPGVNTLGSSDP
jgi:hypothetical protein